MFRAALKWLAVHFRRKDDDGEETEDSRFGPSVLDASVRYAHGMSGSGDSAFLSLMILDSARKKIPPRGQLRIEGLWIDVVYRFRRKKPTSG